MPTTAPSVTTVNSVALSRTLACNRVGELDLRAFVQGLSSTRATVAAGSLNRGTEQRHPHGWAEFGRLYQALDTRRVPRHPDLVSPT